MEKNRGPRKQNKQKPSKTLSDDTLDYYRRIGEVINANPKETAVKAEDFIDNVFTQLTEEAVEVCKAPEVSCIVERLVIKASAKNLQDLLAVFAKDWMSVCRDRCTSHVLQKILMVLPKFISTAVMKFDFENTSENVTMEDKLIKNVLELTELMLTDVKLSVTDVHVSHILRTLLQILGGTCVTENVVKSRSSRNYKQQDLAEVNWSKELLFSNFEVPLAFCKFLKTFYKHIFALENFGVYLTNTNASPAIQTLILVLHKADHDLCQKVIHKVIKVSRIEDTSGSVNIPPVAMDNVGSYLVELIVSLSSEKVYRELHRKLFKGKLLQFATHPCANFVLQKLIKFCPDGNLLVQCLEELRDHVEDIMRAQYYGVLVALAGACEKHQVGQEHFIQMMLKCLQCEDEDRQGKFVLCLATLRSYESISELSEPAMKKVNYHGSLLLQSMLRFSDIEIVTAGLKSLEPAEIATWSCDPCGSHVIDVFFQSLSVDNNTKEAILNKLNEHLISLACDKNGSRTLESIWKNVTINQKTQIATSLCKQGDRIRSDRFGFHIHRNFALFHFVKRRQDWMSIQQNDMKKRKMFQDVFESGQSAKKKKKKNKKVKRK